MSQSEYQQDRDRADEHLPQIRKICGEYLLTVAPDDEDRQHATDVMVTLGACGCRIGCRVRDHEYLARYPWDITFRYARRSGARTEWEKVVYGYGDWMFYGFASPDNSQIVKWTLLDLGVFRGHIIMGFPVPEAKVNKDGKTAFIAFDLRKMPRTPDMIIASSHPLPAFEVPGLTAPKEVEF